MKRVVSPGGGEEGEEEDMYEVTIEFNIEEHPVFKRKGSDVFVDVPITYTQAVLGDIIQVPNRLRVESF